MENKTLIIGITGVIGSGKTTVSNILRNFGYSVFDTDTFSKQIIQKEKIVINMLTKILKKNIYVNGNVNYKKIGTIFENYPALEKNFENWYQVFLGNKIKEKVFSLNNGNRILFFDTPFLFKKQISNFFDYIWIIESNYTECFQRIKLRNNYSNKKIINLIKNSRVKIKKTKKNVIIIKNNSSINQLELKIKKELSKLLKKIKKT